MKTIVMHIITNFEIGGAQKVAYNIATSGNTDFEYHIVEVAKSTSDYALHFIAEAERNGIIVHRSNTISTKPAILKFPFWFHQIVKTVKPHIIHTHTEVPDLALYLYTRLHPFSLKNTKGVRTIHNNQLWNRWNFIGNIVEHFLQKFSTNIAISKSVQNSYANRFGEKCPIIYNGLVISQAKTYPHLVADKINIVFAGRLEYQKGIDVLCDIIKCLGNDSRFHFHIIGDGSLRPFVEKELKGLKNFSYKHHIYQLSSYIGSFDFLLMPSIFEGLALMPIEASLARTPSIINDAPGLAETLPANWPLKVHDNSVDDFISLINSLDKQHYATLQETAYDFATTHFSLTVMQQNYENLYQKA